MTQTRLAPGAAVDLAASYDQLGAGFPHLLVHTRANQFDLAAPICAAEGLGAAVCVKPNAPRAVVLDLVERFARNGADPAGLILDTNRYSGKNRVVGNEGMSASWVRLQANAGIAHPLTDGGYVPEGDFKALRASLQTSASMGPNVIASLAVANRFLSADVNALIDEINAARVPVGLMVEHGKDPFGPRRNVTGLLKLLDEADVEILLLRSDLSVLGALAWGARGGAFGTATSLRHVYPAGRGGGRYTPSIAAILRGTLSLARLSKIDDAIQRAPGPIWSCPCGRCYGRPLNWIRTENEAFEHSLSVVADMAAEITDRRLTPTQRREVWRGMCHSAQFFAHDLDATTRGAWGEPPDFLGAWVAQHIDVTATS